MKALIGCEGALASCCQPLVQEARVVSPSGTGPGGNWIFRSIYDCQRMHYGVGGESGM